MSAAQLQPVCDPELLNDFAVESMELLASVEPLLLAIENDPTDIEYIHALFRVFHTIKGIAGFLNFQAMEEVAHQAENILDRVRSGRSALTSASINRVLRAANHLKESISMCLESPRNSAILNTTIPTSAPLLPIGHLFSKMERVVRDLAFKSGKLVAFETNGDNTELERTTVKRLAAPMLHMMRNSVDHGLETMEERLAHGKPAFGVVRLGAEQESGHILISVSDDGRGLNKQRIIFRAQKRGLINAQARLTDYDIFRLIFLPGFSTAEQVTELSGRGVGMDVVYRHIHKLRGTIQIESVEGEGCSFTLRFPLLSHPNACF